MGQIWYFCIEKYFFRRCYEPGASNQISVRTFLQKIFSTNSSTFLRQLCFFQLKFLEIMHFCAQFWNLWTGRKFSKIMHILVYPVNIVRYLKMCLFCSFGLVRNISDMGKTVKRKVFFHRRTLFFYGILFSVSLLPGGHLVCWFNSHRHKAKLRDTFWPQRLPVPTWLFGREDGKIKYKTFEYGYSQMYFLYTLVLLVHSDLRP